MVKFYYEELKNESKEVSLEDSVDNFWNNCLPKYFTPEKLYGIEQQSRAIQGEKKRPDFTVRCVRNGVPKKVVMFEDKRKEFESQSAKWRAAVRQLRDYLILIRSEQSIGNIYGSVTIGTYARFYYLGPQGNEMKDFVKQDEPLELKDDEEKIHEILTQWVELTKH